MINEKHGNRAEVCNIATRAQILKGKDGKLCRKASSIATLTDCRLEDIAGASAVEASAKPFLSLMKKIIIK